MCGSSYYTCTVSLAVKSMGQIKWQTDSSVDPLCFVRWFVKDRINP